MYAQIYYNVSTRKGAGLAELPTDRTFTFMKQGGIYYEIQENDSYDDKHGDVRGGIRGLRKLGQ